MSSSQSQTCNSLTDQPVQVSSVVLSLSQCSSSSNGRGENVTALVHTGKSVTRGEVTFTSSQVRTTSVEGLNAHDTRTQSASRKEVTTTEQSPPPLPTKASSSLQVTQVEESHRITKDASSSLTYSPAKSTNYSFDRDTLTPCYLNSSIERPNVTNLPSSSSSSSSHPHPQQLRSSLSHHTLQSPVNQLSSYKSSPVLFVSKSHSFPTEQSTITCGPSAAGATCGQNLPFPSSIKVSINKSSFVTVSTTPATSSIAKSNLLTKLTWTNRGVTTSIASPDRRLSLNYSPPSASLATQEVNCQSKSSRSQSVSTQDFHYRQRQQPQGVKNSLTRKKRRQLTHQKSIDRTISSSFDNEKQFAPNVTSSSLQFKKVTCIKVPRVKVKHAKGLLINHCSSCECEYGSDDVASSIEAVDGDAFFESDDENNELDDLNSPKLTHVDLTSQSKSSSTAPGKQVLSQLASHSSKLAMAFAGKNFKKESNIVKFNSHALNDDPVAGAEGVSTNGQTTSTSGRKNISPRNTSVDISSTGAIQIAGCTSGSGNGDHHHRHRKSSPSGNDQLPMTHESIVLIERETWDKKTEFLLAVIGFAVDLGNVWRFPFVCYRNGGGAFLIPWIVMLIFGGLPLFYLELALGQYYRNGCLTLWKRICPVMKGIGYAICLTDLYMAMYYNTIIAWAVYYLSVSFTTELPWTNCNNTWNTPSCMLLHQRSGNVSNATSPAEEFFERQVLQIHQSGGFDNIGPIKWSLALCLACVFILVYFSLWKGVKSSGKAVWVTATMPYFVLFALLIRGITLEGSYEGILYYLSPQWDKLLEINVWIDAATQIFFSLGPGFGTLLALSSYNKFNNNCYRDAIFTSTINCLTSFLAGFVIFSVLGYMAFVLKKDVSNVAADGPGLVFVVYPEAIANMPGSCVWSVLFFIMLITLGLDSTFGGLEAMITGLCDEYPTIIRVNREYFVAILLVFIWICALPTTTYGGQYVVQFLDLYGTSTSVLFIVFIEAIAVCWFYGSSKFSKQIKQMLGFTPGLFWRICWKYITPVFLFAILTASIVNYKDLEFKGELYPKWSIPTGWLLTLSSMSCIPIYALYMIITQTSGSFKERLLMSIKPQYVVGDHLGPSGSGANGGDGSVVLCTSLKGNDYPECNVTPCYSTNVNVVCTNFVVAGPTCDNTSQGPTVICLQKQQQQQVGQESKNQLPYDGSDENE